MHHRGHYEKTLYWQNIVQCKNGSFGKYDNVKWLLSWINYKFIIYATNQKYDWMFYSIAYRLSHTTSYYRKIDSITCQFHWEIFWNRILVEYTYLFTWIVLFSVLYLCITFMQNFSMQSKKYLTCLLSTFSLFKCKCTDSHV